jgi:hypothetical protein
VALPGGAVSRLSEAARRAWLAVRADVGAALPGWATARALVGAAYVLSVVAAEHMQDGARTLQLHQGLFAWDGGFYRGIAEHGYRHEPIEALRFFPLFPVLGRAVGVLALGNEAVGLLVVGNVLALVAGALLHRLALRETADPRVAARAAWLIALVPSAFVLVWGYSEAVMLAAAIGAFLAYRTGRWEVGAALGAAAALSRPIGVMLVVPAAIEAARGLRAVHGRERSARLLAVAGPVGGLVAYLVWAGIRFDSWLDPLRLQGDFRGRAVNPLSRLIEGAGQLAGNERLGDGLHLPFALVFLALLVVVARTLPASYTAFAAVVLVAALSAENLNSLERYGLNAFPLVLGLAIATRDPRVERATFTACGAGFVALAALAWFGAYVP